MQIYVDRRYGKKLLFRCYLRNDIYVATLESSDMRNVSSSIVWRRINTDSYYIGIVELIQIE
jgi:hypothetical protein